MIQRHFEIEQIAPWIVSGASSCYVVARARQLSRARPTHGNWFHFLTRQSDVILALCGCPAVWHFARRRAMVRRTAHTDRSDRQRLAAGAVHHLRQVFTVLLLGLGMIARRASDYKTLVLVERLQRITRTGASLLSTLDEPSAAEPEAFGWANHDGHTQRDDSGEERYA